jgi:hypothetical protein
MNDHHTSNPICGLCEEKLKMADNRLQNWFSHLKANFPGVHVAWSYRNELEQAQALLDHKTKLKFPDSAHNKVPARALDLFEINEDHQGVWNPKFFSDVCKFNLANEYKLKWGGNFASLGDYDHYELEEV